MKEEEKVEAAKELIEKAKISGDNLKIFFSNTGGKFAVSPSGNLEIFRNPEYTDLTVESFLGTIHIVGSQGEFQEKVNAAIKVMKLIDKLAEPGDYKDTGVSEVA